MISGFLQGSGSAQQCVFSKFSHNKDEINCLAINKKGTLLAAADDAGLVAVVDIAADSLVRTLCKGHSNIASCVAFRQHQPWQLISGGLDHQILKWDFSSGKVLQRWNLGQCIDYSWEDLLLVEYL